MRPSPRILPAALALLFAATALAAEGSVPAGYETRQSRPLAAGVTHDHVALADPAQSVHVARVAPGAARVVAVSSHNAVAHQDLGAELPSAMCRRVGCLAGVNADFGDGNGAPVGGVVSGGRLLRSPIPGRAQLIVTRDGRLQAGPLDWSGSVSGDGQTVPVGGVNVALHPGDVVLYTSAWAGDTPDGADIELLVHAPASIGTIGATTTVEIAEVRSGRGPIPAGRAVLAASGPASAALQDFAGRAGSRLELRIQTVVDVVESVGGHPVLLRGGQPAFPDSDDSFTRARHPRSLVGWNPAGEVVLVTVDGGRADASGMTLDEAAALLAGLGASDGFGFDHSSATFVAGGEVQNRPVDDLEPGAPAPAEGREVAPGHWERPALNALMIMPKSASPPPPPTANPGPGSGSGSGSGAKPGGSGPTGATGAPKLSVAGGGSSPGTGAVGGPAAKPGSPVLPNSVGDILRNPTTKRPRRLGKVGKGKKNVDGPVEEVTADASIPDWDDITAALTPEAVSSGEQHEGLSLGLPVGGEPPGRPVGPVLLRLLAGGMIVTVLWGLQQVRRDTRARPVLWL